MKKNVNLHFIDFASWCNGSTTVFGTVSPGSNPCEVTSKSSSIRMGFFCFISFLKKKEIISTLLGKENNSS